MYSVGRTSGHCRDPRSITIMFSLQQVTTWLRQQTRSDVVPVALPNHNNVFTPASHVQTGSDVAATARISWIYTPIDGNLSPTYLKTQPLHLDPLFLVLTLLHISIPWRTHSEYPHTLLPLPILKEDQPNYLLSNSVRSVTMHIAYTPLNSLIPDCTFNAFLCTFGSHATMLKIYFVNSTFTIVRRWTQYQPFRIVNQLNLFNWASVAKWQQSKVDDTLPARMGYNPGSKHVPHTIVIMYGCIKCLT